MTWGKRRAIVIGLLIVALIVLVWAASKPAAIRIPTNGVLVINASGEIEEQKAPDFFSALNGTTPIVLHDYLDAIDTAATDSHITGLVVRVGPLETGWAKLEEIRTHLLNFRKSGKPSICYLGYDGIQNPEYYLASACKEIWLVPTAPVSIRGMMAEALFLRGTLDKLKIVPEFYHIAEFKTATNMFTEKKFTPAHREEVEGLLHSVYNQYLEDASSGRGMDRAQFEALLNRGPFASSDAVTNKIVDRLGYWDQVQDYFKKRDGKWSPISLGTYRSSVSNDGTERIAVIYASGLIVSGDSGSTPGGGSVMGGDSVASDIRAARDEFWNQSDRFARGFGRRLGGGQRSDSPRSGIGRRGETGGGVDVRCCGFGRLLDCSTGAQNRGGSQYDHRLDRRIDRQIECFRFVQFAGHEHGFGDDQRQRVVVFVAAEFHSGAARVHSEISGSDLRGLYQGRRHRPQNDRCRRGQNRQRPGVVRFAGKRVGAGG